jgi:hypothetical protein
MTPVLKQIHNSLTAFILFHFKIIYTHLWKKIGFKSPVQTINTMCIVKCSQQWIYNYQCIKIILKVFKCLNDCLLSKTSETWSSDAIVIQYSRQRIRAALCCLGDDLEWCHMHPGYWFEYHFCLGLQNLKWRRFEIFKQCKS